MKENKDAISPVIGVILMVVIKVILATGIAVLVFEMGPPKSTPQISIKVSDVDGAINETNIKLIVTGGESVKVSDTSIKVNNILVTINSSDDIFDVGDSFILTNSATGMIPVSIMYNPTRQFIFNNEIRVQ